MSMLDALKKKYKEQGITVECYEGVAPIQKYFLVEKIYTYSGWDIENKFIINSIELNNSFHHVVIGNLVLHSFDPEERLLSSLLSDMNSSLEKITWFHLQSDELFQLIK